LDDNCAYHNHEEQFVIEEALENVILISLQFTGVYFVEYLQQDEYIEENRVVLASFVIPVFHVNRGRNSEKFWA
jgi:hypothetical protein